MLTFYLFALILGGGMLLLSVLGGDGGDADLDLDVDVGVEPGADGSASKIFSFRSAIYTLFGFGATGALLTWSGVGGLITLGASIVTGLASGALIGTVFSWLERTDSGAHPGDRSLVGATGRITLPITAEVPGTVIVTRGGRDVQLRARPHASGQGDPSGWRQVMVVEMDASGTALVAPFDSRELTAG